MSRRLRFSARLRGTMVWLASMGAAACTMENPFIPGEDSDTVASVGGTASAGVLTESILTAGVWPSGTGPVTATLSGTTGSDSSAAETVGMTSATTGNSAGGEDSGNADATAGSGDATGEGEDGETQETDSADSGSSQSGDASGSGSDSQSSESGSGDGDSGDTQDDEGSGDGDSDEGDSGDGDGDGDADEGGDGDGDGDGDSGSDSASGSDGSAGDDTDDSDDSGDGDSDSGCIAPEIDCDGECVDPLTDREYCGAQGDCSGTHAGEACDDDHACIDGDCVLDCGESEIDCAGNCVDPDKNNTYCGASGDCTGSDVGETCEAGEVCVAGNCAVDCPVGYLECNGTCVDPLTDEDHCGAEANCEGGNAGEACGFGHICRDGDCVCIPDCNGRECGEDPVCDQSCGECPDASDTCVSGQCECIPDCSGQECGLDATGCGTVCGSCLDGMMCDLGQCEPLYGRAVDMHLQHSGGCAINDRGDLYCWGDTFFPQRDPESALSRVPVYEPELAMSGVKDISRMTDIGDNRVHWCVAMIDGSAYCWGSDQAGYLGNGPPLEDSETPVQVSGFSPTEPEAQHAVAIATGGYVSCALRRDGTVSCWGGASNLGIPTSEISDVPVIVERENGEAITGIRSLECGFVSCCGTDLTGGVRCWGRNTYGELGRGDSVASDGYSVAATILSAHSVLQVAIGNSHSCAVLVDGGVRCWGGGNGSGQLGVDIGSSVDPIVDPVTPVLSGAAIQIDAHLRGTCAALADGSAECWGSNLYGQTGTGGTGDDVVTPTSVIGLAGAVQSVHIGGLFGCAILQTGAIQCWGNDEFGSIGDGNDDNEPHLTPTYVYGFGGTR